MPIIYIGDNNRLRPGKERGVESKNVLQFAPKKFMLTLLWPIAWLLVKQVWQATDFLGWPSEMTAILFASILGILAGVACNWRDAQTVQPPRYKRRLVPALIISTAFGTLPFGILEEVVYRWACWQLVNATLASIFPGISVVLSAAIALVVFALDHRYAGRSGVILALLTGTGLCVLALGYGLVAAIAFHFCFDYGGSLVHLLAMERKR